MFETSVPRVFVMRESPPVGGPIDRQAALTEKLRAVALPGPIAVILDLSSSKSADPTLAALWMRALVEREGGLAVLAVVTKSVLARIATCAISVTAALRHIPVEVRAHASLDQAVAWAASALEHFVLDRGVARSSRNDRARARSKSSGVTGSGPRTAP